MATGAGILWLRAYNNCSYGLTTLTFLLRIPYTEYTYIATQRSLKVRMSFQVRVQLVANVIISNVSAGDLVLLILVAEDNETEN